MDKENNVVNELDNVILDEKTTKEIDKIKKKTKKSIELSKIKRLQKNCELEDFKQENLFKEEYEKSLLIEQRSIALREQENRKAKITAKQEEAKIKDFETMPRTGKLNYFFALLCGIGSAATSFFGIASIGGYGLGSVLAGAIFFVFEMMAIYISKKENLMISNFYKESRLGNLLKDLIMVSSIISNFICWKNVIGTNLFVSGLMAIMFDGLAFYFSNTSDCMKYLRFNYKNFDLEENLLSMIWFNFTWKIRKNIVENYRKNLSEFKLENQKPIIQNQETKIEVTTDKQCGYQETKISEKEVILSKPKKTKINKSPKNYLKHKNTLLGFQDGKVINKDTFGLDKYEWKILRQKFEQDNLVYCEKKKTYKGSKTEENEQVTFELLKMDY